MTTRDERADRVIELHRKHGIPLKDLIEREIEQAVCDAMADAPCAVCCEVESVLHEHGVTLDNFLEHGLKARPLIGTMEKK